ncbi:hypothetical protein GCM10022280_09190 [Sphingomonas swuensis]|uniref:Uncharacterized protein n=1 Tax=Sphingomonas swuensis TaxID=977800 RepID=A0ABP7SL44_9SPHN
MEYPLDVELADVFSVPVSFVVPDLLAAQGSTPDDQPELFVFLTGFAVLTVTYAGGQFSFGETVRVSEEYTQSVELLEQLVAAIPDGARLASINVHDVVSGLVRTPRGEPNDAHSRPSLERLVRILDQVPEDLSLYDCEMGRAVLDSIGEPYGLEPAWNCESRERNPIANGRRLSARAQTLFLASAGRHCSNPETRSAASADLEAWRATGRSIA